MPWVMTLNRISSEACATIHCIVAQASLEIDQKEYIHCTVALYSVCTLFGL